MNGLRVFFWMWACLLTFVGFISQRGGFLVFLMIGWAPLAVILWLQRSGARNFQATHAALLSEAGVASGAGFDHVEDRTGIAINRATRTLVLTAGEVSKTYRYADVREWSSRKETAGVALGGSVQALGANVKMEREAKKNTGLFITVRDVDHPQWRVSMKNEKDRLRWVEILQQEINEGGVAVASAA